MGTRIKPVQPTVIREKAMIEQVIREVRRRPSPAKLAKMDREAEEFFATMVRYGQAD
jgi:hypothetical protein